MEECAIACPNPSRGAPADPNAEFSVLPVRVHPEHGIENAASQCDPVTHTRKQLRLDLTRTVDLPSSKENVIVQRTAGKQHCVVVENGQSVVSNAAQRPHQEAHAQCKVVAVVDTPCKPYFFNCSSTVRHTAAGERATSDGVVGDANDVVFALHLRLKGLPGGVLTELQESDLLFAFANLFQVRVLSPRSLPFAVQAPHCCVLLPIVISKIGASEQSERGGVGGTRCAVFLLNSPLLHPSAGQSLSSGKISFLTRSLKLDCMLCCRCMCG
jgi:hypothetical protein